MHRGLILLTFCAAITPASGQEWHSMFDGKTFAGWETPVGKPFVIEDGCIKSVAHPGISEDLFTVEKYGDFEMEFEWKISPKGNSGLKYRIQDRVWLFDKMAPRFEDNVVAAMKQRRTDKPTTKGQEYVIGFEYQITDNADNPDAKANGPMHRTAALYDMFPAVADTTLKVGEFNRSRILVKGDHFTHWLNGERVLEGSLKAPEVVKSAAKRWGEGSPVYELLVKQPKKECQISLQNHGDEAWFRNLRIRRI